MQREETMTRILLGSMCWHDREIPPMKLFREGTRTRSCQMHVVTRGAR